MPVAFHSKIKISAAVTFPDRRSSTWDQFHQDFLGECENFIMMLKRSKMVTACIKGKKSIRENMSQC